MDRSPAQCQKCINANLPRLLAELNELSVRPKPPSGSQGERAEEVGQPSIAIRSK